MRSGTHRGVVSTDGPLVQSPLNGSPGVYCSWSVRRRLMSAGLDDRITGECIGAFRIRLGRVDHPIDLDEAILHLSDASSEAWTARWDGLPEPVQQDMTEQLGEVLPNALYHCHHALLADGAEVTFVPAARLITDLAAPQGRRWAAGVAWNRVLPGIILLSLSVALA